MKTLLLHVCAFLALAASASAVIFGVDAFDYPDGPVDGQTGGVSWDRTNAQFFSPSGGPSNWDNVVNAPTVLLGRLVTNNSAAKREYKGSPETDGAVNETSFSKVVYYRATVTTGPTLPDFFGLSSFDFGSERVFWGKRFAQAHFGVETTAGGNVSSGVAVLPNTTYTLVAKLDFANNLLSLWVNPDLTTGVETAPTETLGYTLSFPSTAVRLASGNTGSPVTWDDITVATAWSDLAVVVNTAVDVDHGALGGTQSLRDCLKYGPKGATILFAPGLNGATLSLDSEIALVAGRDHIVDASALSNGITINDGAANSYRLIQVDSGAQLEVRGVTFANAGASAGSIDGGAIRNQGTLTLTRCTLSGNAAGSGNGGALYSSGKLIANQCTFSGNSATSGGAIDSAGDSRLVHCTLTGNTAVASGGGVRVQGSTTLLHCTIAGNTAGNSGGGVASIGENPTQTIVRHSIISGNAGGDVEFIAGAVNTFTSQGHNLIGTGNAIGDFNQFLDLINNFDPLLMPLGSYGGRTRTMPPLAGSDALERAATITGLDADQRGFPRNRDGNNNGQIAVDSGAVEAVFRFVANTNDANAGSLRQALADAAATPGWEAIAFASGLDGGTISLTTQAIAGSALEVNDADGVSIDASSLTVGLTITKPAGIYRLILLRPGGRLSLHHLTLTEGVSAGVGGAVSNIGGVLLATRCTFTGNVAGDGGGAIYSNTSTNFTNSSTTLRQCTLTQNTATVDVGGAIHNDNGLTTLAHCTISGNSAPNNGGGVAAMHGNTDGKTVVQHSIIAGNAGLDVVTGTFEAIESLGGNVIGTGSGLLNFTLAGDLTGVGDALLSPLGSYGGPTQTMPPRIGSQALDRAVPLAGFGADQRGFARNRDGNADGTIAPDSGAVEASIVAVTTNQDSGAGSLRQAIADAAAFPGADTILFSQALDGGTISLTTFASGTALTVNDAEGVTIDASTLLNGLTITKPPAGNYRLFYVTGGTLALDSLTLTGGTSGDGGAMINVGTTTLTRCTLTGHTGSITAGAVLNIGTFTLDRSTVSGNAGVRGGGLYNEVGATMNVVNSTIVANSASDLGGGIFNAGALFLRHATIVENSAANDGGGISNGGMLTLGNTIVAGNYLAGPTSRSDLHGGGAFTTQGGNLIGSNGSLVLEFPMGLPNANDDFAGSATAPLDARLLPLGSYNGPTQTMPPLAGSRAIDAGINFGLDTIDQRGLDRFADGDNNGLARPDIGAVEAAFRFVTDDGDSGPGTLRQALADAAAAPGWEAITFASTALDGGTISLTTTDPLSSNTGLVITDIDGVAIDATSLPGGLTITKLAGNYRLFRVNSGGRLSLHQLTLTGGSVPGDFGGAISNEGGTLSLSGCTLTGNTASSGGAIFSESGSGRFTEIRRCTITGNNATGKGGAIRNFSGETRVLFSTISGNSAPGSDGGGIASFGNTATFTVVTSSIISGNTGGDVVFTDQATNSFTSQGHNLIGTGNATGVFTQPGDVFNNPDPLLAPLDNYGGPTKTMALLPGSPARNTGSGAAFDQRGFAIFNTPDKGAYESGTLTNYNAFIWETLPATATVPEHAATFDFDGDGADNEGEYIAGTVVTDPLSVFRVTGFTRTPGTNNYFITFPSVIGRLYRLEGCADLIGWELLTSIPPLAGTGGPLTFSVTTPAFRAFFRPRVSP